MAAGRELVAQTRDVLAMLYLDPDMARMVAQDAGLDLRRVEYSDRPIEYWDAILDEAQRQGRVGAILDIAVRAYPAQSELPRLAAAWAAPGAALPSSVASPPSSAPRLSRGLWPLGALAALILVVAVYAVLQSRADVPPGAAATADAGTDREAGHPATDTPTTAPTRATISATATATQAAGAAPPATPVPMPTVSTGTPAAALPDDLLAGLPDLREIEGAQNAVVRIAWARVGNRLATVDRSSSVCIFDTAREQVERCLSEPDAWLSCPAWSPDGERLAAAVDDANDHRAVIIWDTGSWAEQNRLTGFTSDIIGVAWAEDGHRLLTLTGVQGGAQIWDLSGDLAGPVSERRFDFADRAWWMPGGRFIATITLGTDYVLNIWEPDDRRVLTRTLEKVYYYLGSFDLSPDGTRLAASEGTKLHIFDVNSGVRLHTLEHPSSVGTAWSPDSQRLATASDDVIRIWDVSTGAQEQSLEAPINWDSLAWSPDGSHIAFGGGDMSVHIWRVK